ncbi:MAG: molybdopterin biosynthesis protein MoeB [Planctomycetes bacterium ADurb.Bin126]|nr:MAG: molybdopterin biosynthesis protein MoeB [Planctomycetes bacterium ADurb.Bin126]
MCNSRHAPSLLSALLLGVLAPAVTFFVCGCGASAPITGHPPGSTAGGGRQPGQTQVSTPVRWLNPRQAQEELRDNSDLFLLCVADRELYEKGHIAGSVLIPAVGVEKFIEHNTLWPAINQNRSPRKDQPLLLYCYWKDCVCPTMPTWSDYALKILQQKGFTRIAVITGGLPRWKKEGLPVRQGVP